MNMRDTGIDEAIEPLDETEDFDLPLVGSHHGSMDGGVQGGGITSRGENGDSDDRGLSSRGPVGPGIRQLGIEKTGRHGLP